jgi:hypothetical protein
VFSIRSLFQPHSLRTSEVLMSALKNAVDDAITAAGAATTAEL